MAGSFLTVTSSGQETVLEYLKSLYEKTGDLQPVFRDMGDELLESHRARWQAEESPDGEKWLPLSEKTIQKKGHDLILREHDYLRDLLNYDPNPLALYFGTPMEYGQFHQFGEGVPERPWLGFSQNDIQTLETLIREYLALN